MKHLKSRHVPEFVIAQKEWDEILRKKKQLCEIRLMAASGESGNNSPQDFPVYDIGDDDEPIGSPVSRSASREGDVETQETIEDSTTLEKKFDNVQHVEKEEPQQEHKPLETTASASAQPIPGTVTPIIGDTSGNDVSETVSKILQSMGVPTYASTSNRHFYNGSKGDSASALFMSSTSGYGDGESASRIGAIAARRIQSFVNVLADDLASFPLEKSLLYMRQIRKYMDEKLVESESSTFNSEDDTNIG
uniref:BESS domain-containing protein n=1 Tax=Parascaris univalens TaxID=6257 RepID=A0A914ZIG6_PARUN